MQFNVWFYNDRAFVVLVVFFGRQIKLKMKMTANTATIIPKQFGHKIIFKSTNIIYQPIYSLKLAV